MTTTETHDAALEIAPEIALPRSVVASSYKRRYAERALEARNVKGVAKKVQARSCGDWLAITIAKLCLDEKAKLIVPTFEALLDANGVANAHWNRTTKGWQGRLRMTGRLALQRVVAEADGELALPAELVEKTGEPHLVAPRTWVKAHAH